MKTNLSLPSSLRRLPRWTALVLSAAAIAAAQDGDARLVNLSVRAKLGAGDSLITGVVVRGTSPATVLVRGIGPALALFGIPDPLPAPVLTLATPPLGTISVPPSGSSNSVTPVAVATVAVGAFPLPTNSPDISIVTDFKPGPWSLIISGAPDASGTVLAEIYDARPDNEVGTTKLANLSVRAAVREGTPLIGGFVIGGTATKRYLIRVPGPALASFNVPGAAPDTRLDLMDHTGTVVRSNDNWDAGPAADALELRQAFQRAGAFSFATGSRDAAIVASLAPGLYTVAAYQVGPTGGVALLEIYALDN